MAVILSHQVHDLLVTEACFQQAIQDTRLAIEREKITWQDLALVTDHSQALGRRRLRNGSGDYGPVSLGSAAETILLPGLPGFQPFNEGIEGFSFHRALASRVHIIVRFHKILGMGVGNMFELELGISLGPPDSITFSPNKLVVSAFRIFGDELKRPTWLYHTREEMEACARESIELLQRILPAFETCLMRYFAKLPKELPEPVATGRHWSARDAFQAALAAARVSADDLDLHFINSTSRLLNLPVDVPKTFPHLSQGRLGRMGAWQVIAVLKKQPDQEPVADVPYEGPLRLAWHRTRRRAPGIGDWINSTQAAAKFRMWVGHDFDPVSLALQGYAPAHWLTYTRKRFCRIDAQSGELMG